MNLNAIMKKLQRAILQTGLVIKLGTNQFYSNEQKRMITVFILSTQVLARNKNGEWRMKNHEILRSASGIEIINCLNDIWKQNRDWKLEEEQKDEG